MSTDKALKWTIFTILFLVGLFCMMKSYGYASYQEKRIPLDREHVYQSCSCEWVNPYTHVWKDDPRRPKDIDKKRKEYQEQFEFHQFHAKRTYEDAKNHVWYLPDTSWRQKGKQAWIAAFSTVGCKTPSSALIVAVSSLLMQYGLDCVDEWEYIEDKLKWSKYHFDECDRFAQKIKG